MERFFVVVFTHNNFVIDPETVKLVLLGLILQSGM